MEVVEEFKEELHSLYNTKLPVSRAKIASVTKLAMKSIKHYKHIVMIVEKFIAKSSAPYKLPALYVIDSIVRQSKHQFNESKEMYGPRFGKRLDKIFSMLYQCTEADKPKIARVLNLWQKNSVFPSEVLQLLLDQAPPPPSTGSPQEQPSSTQPILNEAEKKGEEKERKDEQNESLQQDQIDSLLMEQQDQLQNLLHSATTGTDQSGMLVALIDKAKQLQDLQALQQKIMKNSPSEEKGVEGRGGEMKREEITAMDKAKMSQSSMVANEFSKALLDNFDYSSDEEGDVKLPAPAISNDNSDASAIIDQLEEQFKREKEQELVKVSRPSRFHPASPPPPPPRIIDELTPPTSYRAPPIPPPPPPPPRNLDWRPPPDISRLPPRLPPPPSHLPPPPPPSHLPPSHLPPRMQNSWREEREWSSYSHSHSRRYSRSPSPRRGHFPPPSPPPPRALPSRSFQRDRSPVHRYERGRRRSEESRYRGDDRRDRDSRSRDNEREYESGHFRDRFRDREREPRRHDDDRDHSSREKSRRSRRSSSFSRSGFVTVKSKTVWIGHIIKGVSESQLSSMIEQFGKIKSIDFILARGCAYVVMETRDAAKKVVEDLKDPRVLGQKCKVAWAPGRGAKGQTFDRYWDAAVGVSVIPWEHVKSRSEVETLSNGGMVETSTLPPQLKEEVTEVDMED